jgi:hypothetical protein
MVVISARWYATGVGCGGGMAYLYVNKDTFDVNDLPKWMESRRNWGIDEFLDAAKKDRNTNESMYPGYELGAVHGFWMFLKAFRFFKAKDFVELGERMEAYAREHGMIDEGMDIERDGPWSKGDDWWKQPKDKGF